jgi:hypothetical protein
MDYIDPAPTPPRDEPIKPLSPEEVEIAVNNYNAQTLSKLFAFLNASSLPLTTTNTNEKEDIDPRHN